MKRNKILMLGIGNVLWADEGFGVRVIEAIHRKYQFDANVRLMDGGTQGIYLVQHVQQADVLIIFDAIDYGLPPGALKRVENGDVPRFMGAKKMSLHQTGFQEVLALAELTGRRPERMLLIGVQPVELDDYGGSLRPAVRAQIEPAIAMALEYLAGFNIVPVLRNEPLPDRFSLNSPALNIEQYENQRPSEQDACRIGDERFLVVNNARSG